jgi:hypothetical protein
VVHVQEGGQWKGKVSAPWSSTNPWINDRICSTVLQSTRM